MLRTKLVAVLFNGTKPTSSVCRENNELLSVQSGCINRVAQKNVYTLYSTIFLE